MELIWFLSICKSDGSEFNFAFKSKPTRKMATEAIDRAIAKADLPQIKSTYENLKHDVADCEWFDYVSGGGHSIRNTYIWLRDIVLEPEPEAQFCSVLSI